MVGTPGDVPVSEPDGGLPSELLDGLSFGGLPEPRIVISSPGWIT